MKIVAILAMDKSRLIGSNNGLPWHIPEDLKRFKEFTKGHTIVMGKNTYFSLPESVRPLPYRRNIVISREPIKKIETYTSIDAFLQAMHNEDIKMIYLIGGASLYDQFFARGLIDEVELTLISDVHNGDIYVQEFRTDFTIQEIKKFSKGEFQKLVKKDPK